MIKTHKRIAVAAIAFGIAGSFIASSAADATTIHDTHADGSQSIAAWGAVGAATPTYGQTILAPDHDTELDYFDFDIASNGGDDPILFRAEVFAWDDTTMSATGPSLWSSSTTTVPASSSAVYGFEPHIVLEPGKRYVLLGTTVADAQDSNSYAQWITEDNGDAIDGQMVWNNDAQSESDLTTVDWDGTNWPDDLAMKIVWHGTPQISALSTSTGTTAGGDALTITGTDFDSTSTKVTIGGTAVSAKIVSDTQLSVSTPAHAAGSAPVVVSNAHGDSTAASFTYVAPAVAVVPAATATTAAAAVFGVKVSHKQLVAGSRETVTAKGLSAGESYTVRVHGKTVATGKANAKGVATRSFALSAKLAGTETVKVIGSTSARKGSAAITVLAKKKTLRVSFTPSPIVGSNRTITATVKGLGAGENVAVRFHGSLVSPKKAVANAHGTYTVTFSAGWSWGLKTLRAVGAGVTRSGSIKVDVEAR